MGPDDDRAWDAIWRVRASDPWQISCHPKRELQTKQAKILTVCNVRISSECEGFFVH
jgi:hypothetical protein